MGCSLLLRQLWLLLWKNFVLQIRRPIGTVFELLIPALALLVLVGIRQIPGVDVVYTCLATFESDYLQVPKDYGTIYYAPNNSNATAIMRETVRKWPQLNESLIALADEAELVNTLMNMSDHSGSVCEPYGRAGVVFGNVDSENIVYTLRFPDELDWATDQLTNSFVIDSASTSSSYMEYGFVNLQRIVEESIIAHVTREQETVDVDLAMRQFPYPPTSQDPFLAQLGFSLSLLLMLAFIYTFSQIVKELVIEKETRIRESMLMMGLRQWVLWAGWFIKQLLFMLIWVIAFPILMKFTNVWPESDIFLLFIFFLLYVMTVIAFGFLVSVWFNSPRVSLIVSFILFFLSFVPMLFIPFFTDKIPYGGKLALSLLSNTAFGQGATVISHWEESRLGLQWTNIAKPLSIIEPLNMGAIFGMMICDIVLYLLLAWYIDAVKPGRYGIPKPLYFPFLPSFWTGKARKLSAVDVESSGWYDPQAHEKEPTDREAGIKIQKLTKVYDQGLFSRHGKRLAVDSLNLNMYEGQITALLGHNGAGKTTTISMLTGLYTPTGGTAVINGYDIRSNMDQIRHSLGICPQHNVLFDRLTVREHLKLFAMLKGMPRSEVSHEVASMLQDLQLMDKTKTAAKNLSGGMKRKLSVGIALIGGSKTVVLDEPTSGMDPYARRATWDLLAKHKEGRTILLTTHFMDEADLLGDRIAIMAEGRLMCSGSSLFLKSRYGVGYHLTLVKTPSCDTGRLSHMITSTVPGSQLASDVSAELTFLLPFTSSQHFPTLLDTLERQRSSLGFSSFGLSLTTMEEVFMKVGTGSTQLTTSLVLSQESSAGAVDPPHTNSDGVGGEKGEFVETSPFLLSENGVVYETEAPVVRHTGPILWLQQFWAMFLKRFYNSLRFYVAVITQLILPLVFMLMGLILIKIPNSALQDQPSRVLTLRHSALSHNVTTFWAQFGDPSPLFNFSTVTPDEIHASSLFDYTGRVRSIREDVKNYSEPAECCDYTYQLLDKFCASRSSNDYKDNCEGNYNYKRCPDCLKCCSTLYETSALSCEGGGPYGAYSGSYCPSPPILSVGDAYSDSISGPLDSDNTFVAEYLIRAADNLQPSVFFQEVQAGFVVSYQEPPLSFCRLANKTVALKYSALLNVLHNRSAFNFPDNPDCDDNLDFCYDNITSGHFDCQGALVCVESVIPSITSLPGDYYFSLPSDTQSVIQTPVCEEVQEGVAKVYPDQVDTLTVTVWYNNQPYHMVPSALNAFHNVLLKSVMGEQWSITAYNHPLPRTEETKEDQTTSSAFYGLAVSVLGCFGFAFLISSFVVFPVQERECKAKHLQFVSGVNAVIYWLGNYAWDLINALVIVVLTFLLMVAFQTSGYQGQGLGAVFLLMVYTCWAGIPLAYCVSFLFKSHLVAYGVLFLLFFFPPLAFQMAVLLVGDSRTQDILHYLFLLHPGYGLQIGFANIYISQTFKPLCDKPSRQSYCDGVYVEDLFQFDRPGVGSTLMYTAIEGVLLLFLVITIEYSFFIPLIKQLVIYYTERSNGYSYTQEKAQLLEDDDVANERREVLSGEERESDNVVVIRNLSKVYWPQLSGCSVVPSKTAVNNICLTIPRGEFFGFVGVNGAGKTSTFGMLTGDITPSSGTAFVSGYDIRTDMKSVQQQIGYCPQFDALIERMTGRELLTMFARLRGIPESRIRDVVTSTIHKLDLAQYANKQCGKYSGGNKRKLSTAIALIGDPPILFLDEPTTGMDPGTRRYLWDVLTGVTREGRSITLTTHSMEECEALCTRLTIMVNGEFKCLGSIQHLKSKFGSGYTLQAKVNPLMAGLETSAPQSTTTKALSGSPLPPLETADPVVNRDTNSETYTNSGTYSTGGAAEPPPAAGAGGGGGVRGGEEMDTNALKYFIQQNFPGAVLMEEHQGSVTYQLPSAGLTWSSVFRKLEANKDRLGIIDYSVSQTTLDQVFINFAKLQEGVIG